MSTFFAPFFGVLKAAPAILGALCLAAIIILPIMLIAGLLKRSDRRDGESTRAEAELMQELYQGLSRLEHRVESLETILLSKEPRGDKE